MTKRITKDMLNVANMPDTPTARKVLARMLDDDDIQGDLMDKLKEKNGC